MRPSTIAVFLALLSCATLGAQTKWFEADALGIKFKIQKYLMAAPLEGGEGMHLRNRFQPADDKGIVNPKTNGRFTWYFRVFEFEKVKGGRPAKNRSPRDKQMDAARARDYEHWVTEKDRGSGGRKFVTKKKPVKKRGKRPAYDHWEYYSEQTGSDGSPMIWYSYAGAYDLGDRSIALVCTLPVLDLEDGKPEKKHTSWALEMISSLTPTKARKASNASSADASKNEWAKTDEQKAALEQVRQGISSLANWDYYTTPKFIALYDWDKKNQKKALAFAGEQTEAILAAWDLFEEWFPVPEKVSIPYGSIRICHSWSDYQKYGDAKKEQYAHFLPGPMQVITFNDGKRFFGTEDKQTSRTIAQAWAMYAHACFRGAKMPVWFVEGMGWQMSRYQKKGRSLKFAPFKDYAKTVQKLKKDDKLSKIGAMLQLEHSAIDGEGRDAYIAQAYAVADFLTRGQDKLGSKWNSAWNDLPKQYGKALVEKRSAGRAFAAVFQALDLDAMHEAYEIWCSKHLKK